MADINEMFNFGLDEYNGANEVLDSIRDEVINVGYEMLMENSYDDLILLGMNNPVAIAKKIMKYFISTEEYEKCSYLKKFIDCYEEKVINNHSKISN